MSTEALLVQLLGFAIRGLVSTMGIRAAQDVVDETRTKMVAEQRGPTDEELEEVVSRIKARSDRIQNA